MGSRDNWQCGQGRLVVRYQFPRAAVSSSFGEFEHIRLKACYLTGVHADSCKSFTGPDLSTCNIDSSAFLRLVRASQFCDEAEQGPTSSCRARPRRASQTVCGASAGCGGSGK